MQTEAWAGGCQVLAPAREETVAMWSMRAWWNVCGALGGGAEGCGSGWFHGSQKDVALRMWGGQVFSTAVGRRERNKRSAVF